MQPIYLEVTLTGALNGRGYSFYTNCYNYGTSAMTEPIVTY